MGKHTPAAEQRRLVDLWHTSEVSMASFARANGVRPGTFATWVGRHRTPLPPRAFLQLAVVGAAPEAQAETRELAVRVRDVTLRFPEPPPPAWFAALLRELGPC